MRYLRWYFFVVPFCLVGISVPTLFCHNESWRMCAALGWAFFIGVICGTVNGGGRS